MTDKFDFIETVSNTIIERLENFSGEWEKPFFTSFARNVATKKAYRGINILILNFAALFNGFSSSVWGTYRQWQEKGCQIKKGSKATTIVFWKPLSYKCEVENTETGELEEVENQTFVVCAPKRTPCFRLSFPSSVGSTPFASAATADGNPPPYRTCPTKPRLCF